MSTYTMLVFRAVLFYILILSYSHGERFGKCRCKVDMKIYSADCSDLGLANISKVTNCLPSTLKELNLSSNSIQYIPPKAFGKFSFLEDLNLDHNNIEHLVNGTFEGLNKLRNLSLNHNSLRDEDSFADDIFIPLKSIRRLDLQGNCDASREKCAYPTKAISAATSLQNLHIDGFPSFGPGFPSLTHLQSLYFSDIEGYCMFPSLNEATFASFINSSISHLQIDGCDIRKLVPNVFRGLRNLTTLIITDNRRLCSDSVENATRGLNETSIETLKFNNWCRHRSVDIRLGEGMLTGLTNTSLKILDLGSNDINYVDSSCIKNLPTSVLYLSLKDNEINRGDFLYETKRLDNLETVDISNQIANNPNVEEQARELYANFTSKFDTSDNLENDEPVYLPRNVRTIYMNNIKLEFPIPVLTFGPNKLEYLDASACRFTMFLGPWYGLKYLQHFDLSSNNFVYFSPNALVDMPNLRTLLLQRNYIGRSLAVDQEGKTFSSQKKLEALDISNNAIKDLPFHIFQNQMSLRNLSLADNAMKNVSFSLKSMTKLQYLNLSGNEIEYLSKENMNFLDQVAKKSVIHVNLLGNVLSCMCDNQHFVNWLATTKVNIVDKDKLKCLYRNETLVSVAQINIMTSQLKYECSSWIALTSCVVGFVGLLLVFSLLVLLYHKRWQLRYLWYIGRLNIDPYHHPDDQQRQLLDIDAYISYEQHYDVTHDVNLHKVVTDTIYPFLENREYSLKIREEFDATDKLYHVIPETVRKARKMIALLTPSYCKDYWNMFEFNLAAYEGIYTKRSVIIPVLVGNVSDIDLTPEIRSFVRSKIKSKEVLHFPSAPHYERFMDAFNEQLDHLLQC